MKDYRVEIDLLPVKTLAYVTGTSGSLSNPSFILGDQYKGHKGFFFSGGNRTQKTGCWLDGSYKFFDSETGYQGFLGDCLSNNNKQFDVAQSITVSGVEIDYLVLTFDKIAGEYPTELTINGVVHKNYGYIFIVSIAPTMQVDIVFSKWSKANSLVKVLSIKCGLTKKYDMRSLQKIQFDNAMIAGSDVVKFGILTQTGSLKIKDDGTLRALSDNNLLDVGAAVRIYEDSTLIQSFITNDYDCNDLNSAWDVPLTDATVLWEEEQFEGLTYASRTLKQLLDLLIPGIVHADPTYLSSIVIPASFLRVSTRWQAIVKCCTIGMLRIYAINGVVYSRRVI